ASKAEDAISNGFNALEKHYNNVTKIRNKYAKILIENITSELRTLGMKDAQFDIVINTLEDKKVLQNKGVDSITFYFSANKGEPLKTMSKVISGGEMSRFMLSLKLVTEQVEEPITYIFDEIDAGISGVVAQIVAEKFTKLSIKNQIITITHLPQIVSYSDKSFLIEKTTDGDVTQTHVKGLNEEEKEQEIVRIIGGREVSNAIELARQIIANANLRKKIIKNS
ncbi:MAG: DNA repair protein RecN, partial [Clostridia bacterium]|nr:DNA repair protein RecN [Clostridia bacterium]